MPKVKKIALVVLLIALAVSLGFNYILFEQVQTLSNKYGNMFALSLKIDVYHNGVWKNALYKTGDLLKFDFGNLTQLFLMARGTGDSLSSLTITFYVLATWIYSLQNYTAQNGFFTSGSGCTIYQFTASDLVSNSYFLWGYIPPTSKSGTTVTTVPFIIGFGNSTAPFGTPFPSLGYSTATVSFGYKGNLCWMAAHEGAVVSNGEVVTRNTNYATNRIFLNYTGYWTNQYTTSYSIVYTRLWIPFLQIRNIQGFQYVYVYWLLIAEDAFSAVTLNSGDIVRVTYSLQINP